MTWVQLVSFSKLEWLLRLKLICTTLDLALRSLILEELYLITSAMIKPPLSYALKLPLEFPSSPFSKKHCFPHSHQWSDEVWAKPPAKLETSNYLITFSSMAISTYRRSTAEAATARSSVYTVMVTAASAAFRRSRPEGERPGWNTTSLSSFERRDFESLSSMLRLSLYT